MPIHDWSRAEAGIFHHFHQAWTIEISNALNAGILPGDYFALAEQVIGAPIPDVVTLQRQDEPPSRLKGKGGIAVADAPPHARFVVSAEADVYASRANQIVIEHRLGRIVAVIEIVSPGNKSSTHALRTFVEKAAQLLHEGISLLVIDLFPPTARDPDGIHKAIWDNVQDEPFLLPRGKPLLVAAYSAGQVKRAYIEPLAKGDVLPDMPIFLDEGTYVLAPLEQTYNATWDKCPAVIREMIGRKI